LNGITNTNFSLTINSSSNRIVLTAGKLLSNEVLHIRFAAYPVSNGMRTFTVTALNTNLMLSNVVAVAGEVTNIVSSDSLTITIGGLSVAGATVAEITPGLAIFSPATMSSPSRFNHRVQIVIPVFSSP